MITSFEDLGNRFSGKDNAVLRKISSRRINRNYYDAILKTFKNVKERIESDSTGTFGGSYKGKDDQDAFNRLENEFEGMKKSLFEIAYQQQSVISDQLLNKDADLEEQLTFLDYLEGEIAKYRSDLRKRKPRFPVEETSFEDFVSEISKRKKIKQMLFNISEEKNINTKLWLTFEQMRQELKDQAEHEQGN